MSGDKRRRWPNAMTWGKVRFADQPIPGVAMTTFKLYGIWERVLAQWLPEIRYTRRANLIWLIVGLYLSEKVQMSAIVKKWPIAVKANSLTRRLSRFLDNPAIRPAVWY